MLELISKKAKIISYHRDYCRNNSKVQSKNGRKRHKVDIGAAPKSKRKDRGKKNVDIKSSATDEFLARGQTDSPSKHMNSRSHVLLIKVIFVLFSKTTTYGKAQQ